MAAHRRAWGVDLPIGREAAMTASGAWHNRILTEFFDRNVAASPDKTAIVAMSGETATITRLSYAELARMADKIALGLYAIGIRKGDVVSFQLHNCPEFLAIVIACIRIGAVTHPVMPILRQRELTFMLRLTGSRVLIVPTRFRGFDYAALGMEVAAAVPTLRHVFAIGGDGAASFAGHFLDTTWERRFDRSAVFAGARPGPNDVMQLIFTSGTTGEPKGVMHTANTLFANVIPFAETLALSKDDIGFSPTPIAHQLGYLFGVLTPLFLGGTIVLQDLWQSDIAASLLVEERVTYCMGATPFLNDLANHEAIERIDTSSLRYFISGGAAIPSALVRRAQARMGCKVIAVWGMTEVGAVTAVRPNDSDVRSCETDGTAIAHTAVRIVDTSGEEMPRGEAGRLLTRGASQFVGYFKRPELYAVDQDGWLDTGDLARMDADGYVRITGRSKDIIIRGGENIPVVEIEALLYEHPAVRIAAIVAMPDPRLGERACAFVQTQPGTSLTMEQMCDFLRARDVAPAYLPERLVIIEVMPVTPSGKIQKFQLRELAAALPS